MSTRDDRLEELIAQALDRLQDDPRFDLQAFAREHPDHHAALDSQFEKLRAIGWLPGCGRSEATGSADSRAATEPETFDGLLESLRRKPPLHERYEVRQEIGRGGMGRVFAAFDRELRRTLAMKVLRAPSNEAARREMTARFLEEARITGQLDHQGIVPIHDLGFDEQGALYYTMRLIAGRRTLARVFELARDEAEGWTRVRGLDAILRACEAVAYAHQRGVIHRDLKPTNIMVGPLGEVFVVDWGLSRVLDAMPRGEPADLAALETGRGPDDSPILTLQGQALGTPYYMSPEQARGDRDAVDARSDVYAVGAILYEFLAGHPPYGEKAAKVSSRELVDRIVAEPPTDVAAAAPTAPAELLAICERAMQRRPEARYPSIADLADDLRAFVEGRVVTAYETGAWAEARKWVRRNKALALAFAAVVLAVVAGGVAFGVKAGEASRSAQVVDRLTALQDLEDLLEEADERLWPPYPDKIERYRSWIAAAEALVAALPGYRARREEYRARALPRSDEERRRERETHPHLLRLISLQRELAAKRAALLQRRDGVSVELPALDWSAQPQSREALVSRAWALMHPDRLVHGREAEALVLARRALELSGDEPEHRAPSHHTLAWAQLSLGRDEAARAAAAAALEAAPAEARESWERNVAALRAAVEQASSTEGLLAAEREVARLERAVAVLEARIDWRSGWRFPPEQAEARWWNANLTLLIDGLVELAQEDAGLLSPAGVSPEHGWSIPRRLAFARKLEAGFAEGGCHAAAWRAALPAIRAAYPGLDLGVQMGLVPLGPDPDSGLWEFAHLVSGAPAERARDERLVLTEEMGVVLVLLPGGVFRMGAQSTDPAGPNHDPDATDAETPVHEVELSPFFLSKYEMTRGQWSRSTGSDPSYAALSLSEDAQRQPVRNVSWRMCTDLLPRCDLLLPSEAQWEYATRAGTDTAYPTGSEPRSLWVRPAGNLTREAALESGADPELADDFPVYAPVGAFAPNAFGLHDMIGNVAELCLDGYDPRFYAMSPRTDPVAPWAAAQTTVARGGAYLSGARAARSSWRTHHHLDYLHSAFGVRPARAVER